MLIQAYYLLLKFIFNAGRGDNSLNRNDAYRELCLRITSEKRRQHSIAIEAIMRQLSDVFQEDTDLWGMAGLLHDIDLEIVDGDLNKHGLAAERILEGFNADPSIIVAIKAHNPTLGFERRRKLDKALFCSDHLPNFIEKCALSIPSKKISDLDKEYLLAKFEEEGFVKEMNKHQILSCSELGISLDEFFEIGLDSMKDIDYII